METTNNNATAPKRRALGRGLEELFNNEILDYSRVEEKIINETPKEGIIKVKLKDLRANPYQPRKTFDETSLQELADSIKEHGIVQPIIVKKNIKGYYIVAGERRTKAARLAGLDTIPAIVRDFNDQEMMEIALIENIQRENLNPIEEAEGYLNIIKSTNMTQEEVSKKFGKSRSYITNLIGLLKLPDDVKDYVKKGKLSMGHARALSKIEDEKEVERLATKAINEGLSVREIESLQSKVMPPKRVATPNNNTYALYENIMREKIGTKVKISKNKIEIPFDSAKDLERILEIINITFEE